MSEDAAKIIARSVSKRIADAIAEDDSFWRLVEEEIVAQIKASDQNEAQLWLSSDGDHKVCVNPFGCDEPTVLPFFVPAPDLPVKAERQAQVDRCRDQIAAIRGFAQDLLTMADEAQRSLDKMMLK